MTTEGRVPKKPNARRSRRNGKSNGHTKAPLRQSAEQPVERPAEVSGDLNTPIQAEQPAEQPESMVKDDAPSAIGWTDSLMKALKFSKEFFQLSMEIDREVMHLVAAIVAIHVGDYDVAAMNLWSCGLGAMPQLASQPAPQRRG